MGEAGSHGAGGGELGDRLSRLEEQVGFGEVGQGRLERQIVELSQVMAELVEKIERLEARVRAEGERRAGEEDPGEASGNERG